MCDLTKTPKPADCEIEDTLVGQHLALRDICPHQARHQDDGQYLA